MPVAAVQAFWSYSRTGEHHGLADLHAAMQAGLTEAASPLAVAIFRDGSTHGLPPGQDWARSLVRALALSTLLFWVQSPRWLHRPVCRFEMDAFRNRVWRACTRLGPAHPEAAFARLWDTLVVPIRWMETSDEQWLAVPHTVRAPLHHDWHRRHVHPSLHLAERQAERMGARNSFSLAGLQAAEAIHANVNAALSSVGTTWPRWAALMAEDAREFERDWMDEFERRRIAAGLHDAAAGAPEMGGGPQPGRRDLRRIERPELGLVFVPMKPPAGPAFWCSSAAVANRHAALWARHFPGAACGQAGHSGLLEWRQAEVQALLPALMAEGLDVPDEGQAREILRVLDSGRDAVQQCGLQLQTRRFWHRREDDSLAVEAGADRGVLVLVSPLEELSHG